MSKSPNKSAAMTRPRVGRPLAGTRHEYRALALSIPKEYYEPLVESAKRNMRSISSEVAYILREYFEKKK